MHELIRIDVSGQDRPGLTMALTQVLARYAVTILDIGQSVIHNTLALGLLVEVADSPEACSVFKELLFTAHQLDLTIRFTPISANDYEQWVNEQGQTRHIVTVLGRQIGAHHLARVATVISDQGLNIDRMTRLSGRLSRQTRSPVTTRPSSIEFWLRGFVADIDLLHARLLALGTELDIDIAIQADNIFRRNRRLVCFDMDSTLIQTEVIDELARAAGVGDQVAAITAAAMHGQIDFATSFRQRLALLAGLSTDVLETIATQLPITDGAERLLRSLKQLGYKIAILSGGFTYFAQSLQQRFAIDYVYANSLDIKDGRLTGQVVEPIVDGARKAELLRTLAQREGIRLEQVIAVGDGANDLPMLAIAGLGIAFHAKPVVKEQARHALATVGLDGILYLLGMRDRDLIQLG
jgi:phosphoserine phosphatase